MPEDLDNKIRLKVQSDTDRQNVAGVQRVQRKIRVQAADEAKKAEDKALRADASPSQGFSIMGGGALGIGLVLGMTLALINDFSDLVFWQKMSLVSQTLDITTLIMLLLMVMFTSRTYFFSVFLILVVFILEILPVLGVLPLWTMGVAAWYFSNRQKD